MMLLTFKVSLNSEWDDLVNKTEANYVRPPPTHTHILERKETKHSTLECKENSQKSKISHQKNVNKAKIIAHQ